MLFMFHFHNVFSNNVKVIIKNNRTQTLIRILFNTSLFDVLENGQSFTTKSKLHNHNPTDVSIIIQGQCINLIFKEKKHKNNKLTSA